MDELNDSQIILSVGIDGTDVNKGLESIDKQLDKIDKKPFKSLKQQLKEATIEAQNIAKESGRSSELFKEAAKRVAVLNDELSEANLSIKAFNVDNKFQSLISLSQGVVGSMQGIQGALNLIGVESETADEAIKKMMALQSLSSFLSSWDDVKSSFDNLKTVLGLASTQQKILGASTVATTSIMKLFGASVDSSSKSFKGLRAAIIATGLGALIVLIGTLIANWDKIKESISGVSDEQKKLNELSKERVELATKELDEISAKENILKLQGKTEAQIVELKKEAIKKIIEARTEEIKNAEITLKNQIAAEKRNEKYLQGYLKVVSFPINAIYQLGAKAVNGLINLINKIPGVDIDFQFDEDLVTNAAKQIGNLGFDSKKVEIEGQKSIDELKAKLLESQNTLAGFELQNKNSTAKATKEKIDAKKVEIENELKLEENFQKKKAELERQYFLDSIKDDKERAKVLRQIQYENDIEEILNGPYSIKRQLELVDMIRKNFEKEQQDKVNEVINNPEEDKKSFDAMVANTMAGVNVQINALDQLRKKNEETNLAIANDRIKATEAWVGVAKDASSIITEIAGQDTVAAKAIAVANASFDTYQAINAILKNTAKNPITGAIPGFAIAQAAITGAFGLLQVRNILKTKVPGKSSSTSAPNIGNGNIAPQINSTVLTPNVNANINPESGTSIRAFIVDRDIDNADRRRNFLDSLSKI